MHFKFQKYYIVIVLFLILHRRFFFLMHIPSQQKKYQKNILKTCPKCHENIMEKDL